MPLVTVELRRIVRKEVSEKSAEEILQGLLYVRAVVCIVEVGGEGRRCCACGVHSGSIAAGSRPQRECSIVCPRPQEKLFLLSV